MGVNSGAFISTFYTQGTLQDLYGGELKCVIFGMLIATVCCYKGITAKGGAEGVLVCHGGNVGGYTLFVKDTKLHYVHNYVGAEEFHVASKLDVPEGKVALRYEFEKTGDPDFKDGKGARLQFRFELFSLHPLTSNVNGDLRIAQQMERGEQQFDVFIGGPASRTNRNDA